jgi:hypothetical protein
LELDLGCSADRYPQPRMAQIKIELEKADTLIADNAATIKKDCFVDWLWEKLQTDFGFHPPANGK